MFDRRSAWCPAIVVCLILASLSISGGCRGKSAEPGRFAVAAPELRLTTLDGQGLDLGALRGKVVLLNFWATFCPPCREEMPDFEALHQDLGPDGLSVVGVSLDTVPVDRVRQFLRQAGVTYPVAVGRFSEIEATWGALEDLPTFQGNGADPPVSDTGSVYYIPTTFLIDRQGRIAEKHVGGRTRSQLEPALRRLLASGMPSASTDG